MNILRPALQLAALWLGDQGDALFAAAEARDTEERSAKRAAEARAWEVAARVRAAEPPADGRRLGSRGAAGRSKPPVSILLAGAATYKIGLEMRQMR